MLSAGSRPARIAAHVAAQPFIFAFRVSVFRP